MEATTREEIQKEQEAAGVGLNRLGLPSRMLPSQSSLLSLLRTGGHATNRKFLAIFTQDPIHKMTLLSDVPSNQAYEYANFHRKQVAGSACLGRRALCGGRRGATRREMRLGGWQTALSGWMMPRAAACPRHRCPSRTADSGQSLPEAGGGQSSTGAETRLTA